MIFRRYCTTHISLPHADLLCTGMEDGQLRVFSHLFNVASEMIASFNARFGINNFKWPRLAKADLCRVKPFILMLRQSDQSQCTAQAVAEEDNEPFDFMEAMATWIVQIVRNGVRTS